MGIGWDTMSLTWDLPFLTWGTDNSASLHRCALIIPLIQGRSYKLNYIAFCFSYIAHRSIGRDGRILTRDFAFMAEGEGLEPTTSSVINQGELPTALPL